MSAGVTQDSVRFGRLPKGYPQTKESLDWRRGAPGHNAASMLWENVKRKRDAHRRPQIAQCCTGGTGDGRHNTAPPAPDIDRPWIAASLRVRQRTGSGVRGYGSRPERMDGV